jgi:hypothetical protein
MTDTTNAPGATDRATEIAGIATDDVVAADVSRADDKSDEGISKNDVGEGTIESLHDLDLPGPTFDIDSASTTPDAPDSHS